MRRQSLTDFFTDLAATPGDFLAHDNGYRQQVRSYADVARAARAFAVRLRDAGVRQGDRVVLWGENRSEWIVALWGALISGIVVVPLDYRSPRPFVQRVSVIVEARLWIVGDSVPDETPASETGTHDASVSRWRLADVSWSGDGPMPDVRLAADDTAEILFTSGATADPKGVILTHRNILANIEPIEREIAKYRKFGRPFFPLRFLNLLPLSHMFGQTLATFIPPLLPGTTLFLSSYSPAEIVRTIRTHRVTVLVCVPRMLDVLRTYVLHAAPSAREPSPPTMHWTRRWWRHLDAHRQFGQKFWCVVVGAAPLDPELESFWSRLGFLVIQGYGLTETAPVVTLNHPLASRKGSVGTPIEGVEVKLAPDGEILVRGDNVTRGYYNEPDATDAAFEDGWLKTGDLGEFDAGGHLFVRGRKKDTIVAPDGTKVFPSDVERVIDAVSGVRESAVVGRADGARESVHAVVVLDDDAILDQVVAAANARLAPHQLIRSAVQWPGVELPRTDGTRKLKRAAIRQWAAGAGGPVAGPQRDDSLHAMVARFAGGRTIGPETTLDDAGLGSLDRVELMVAMEQRFHTSVDEVAFASAKNLHDLRQLLDEGERSEPRHEDLDTTPRWNTSLAARVVRRAVLGGAIFPMMRYYAPAHVSGTEHLAAVQGPAIFAANHQSHMDTPVIMAALPRKWRYRLAPAMRKEYFSVHFHPEGHSRRDRLIQTWGYRLAVLCLAAFPLPQRDAGSRLALRHMGWLASKGYSILVFPEGIRTEAGELRRFQAGIGIMASRLDLPVVPVRIDGLERVLHKTWNWPKRNRIRVSFGPPLRLAGDDFVGLAAEVERAVRAL